jgi:hypothetical protein
MTVILLTVAGILAASPREEADLELVRLAQRANATRHPHGQMQLELRQGQVGKLSYHTLTRVTISWLNEKSRAETKAWKLPSAEAQPEHESQEVEIWLVDDVRAIGYTEGRKRVSIQPTLSEEVPLAARLRPSDFWYGQWGPAQGISWIKLLDPRLVTAIDNSKIQYETRRVEPNQIQIDRHDAQLGSDARLIASIPDDGNIIAYTMRMPSAHYVIKGTCAWKRDAGGEVCLTRRAEQTEFNGPEGRQRLYKSVEVVSVDLAHRPSVASFDLKSLDLPPGTRIHDQITGKSIRVGDRVVEDVAGSLEGLSITVRSRGFARPGR